VRNYFRYSTSPRRPTEL